jgi:hypothetical protein
MAILLVLVVGGYLHRKNKYNLECKVAYKICVRVVSTASAPTTSRRVALSILKERGIFQKYWNSNHVTVCHTNNLA